MPLALIACIVGSSEAMTSLRHLVARVATSPTSTVLLTGESGTGKDVVAKVIHYVSERSSRPFMTITCSALPEQLLESELFGHERGAFTDARVQKRRLLETADKGTTGSSVCDHRCTSNLKALSRSRVIT